MIWNGSGAAGDRQHVLVLLDYMCPTIALLLSGPSQVIIKTRDQTAANGALIVSQDSRSYWQPCQRSPWL